MFWRRMFRNGALPRYVNRWCWRERFDEDRQVQPAGTHVVEPATSRQA